MRPDSARTSSPGLGALPPSAPAARRAAGTADSALRRAGPSPAPRPLPSRAPPAAPSRAHLLRVPPAPRSVQRPSP